MNRIAFGLAGLVVCVALLARAVGVLPDPHAEELARRRAALEAIAIEAALLAGHGPPREALPFAKAIARRTPELLSIGLREDATGKLAAEYGGHELHWARKQGPGSTPEHVATPITRKDGTPWLTVEAAFRPLPWSGLWEWFGGPMIPLMAFLFSAPCFAAVALYLRQVFRKVDVEQANIAPQRVKDTLNTLAEGVLVLDRDGRIVLANDAFAKDVGAAPDALRGRDAGDFDWQGSGNALTPWTQSLREATPQRGRLLGLRTGAEEKTLSINASPIFGEDGVCRGALASFDDVTLIARARVAAEAASKAKGEFLASVSHELRTPMNAILGMTEMVLEGDLKDDQRECLGIVAESANGLLNIVNDLLDLAKIEAGRFDLEPAEFDLRAALDEALRGVALRAHQKGLELVLDVAANVPERVVGDAARLRQALLNLIGNAVKFTAAGTIAVGVRVDRASAKQATLHFAVSDTGAGVPPEKLKAIFEPYDQGDQGTRRRYGGTGLGLTITSQLAALMGGRAWAESAPGRGSVFHFTMEAALAAGPPKADVLQLPEGYFAVVAEGHAGAARALSGLLASLRLVAAVRDTAEEALQALHERHQSGQPADLLLFDAGMPHAFELAEQALRAGVVKAAVAMAASSDLANVAERAAASGPGTCGPLGRAALLRAVREAGDQAPGSRPPGAAAAARTLRCLVVEDNEFNRRVAAMRLERWGHQVECVPDGPSALQVLQSVRYDVVFTDIEMPGMNGLELAEEIRRREAAGAVRVAVVAMTAHSIDGTRDRCMAAGMDDFVSKPLRDADLQNVLARVAPGAALSRTATPPRPAAAAARSPFPPPSSAPAPRPSSAAPPAANAGKAAFDPLTLAARVGGNADTMAKLIGHFHKDAAAAHAEIRAAAEAGAATRLRKAAHTLKGMLLFLGADAAAHATRRLEALADAHDGALDIPAAFATAVELERLLLAVAEQLEGMGHPVPAGWLMAAAAR